VISDIFSSIVVLYSYFVRAGDGLYHKRKFEEEAEAAAASEAKGSDSRLLFCVITLLHREEEIEESEEVESCE
jgi:hypothetical protein